MGVGLLTSIGVLIFLTATAIIIYGIVRSVSQWGKDQRAPRLSVAAKVVSKRAHTSVQHHSSTMDTRRTVYYATFEFDSSDRMELSVPQEQYGYLVEGDCGILQFQGSRFLGFVRQ